MSKLLEEILSKDNIDLAIKRVKSNKGAPGVFVNWILGIKSVEI